MKVYTLEKAITDEVIGITLNEETAIEKAAELTEELNTLVQYDELELIDVTIEELLTGYLELKRF